MEDTKEANILADTFESVRNLTKFFMQPHEGTDLYKQHEVNGVKMNSAFWIIAHLVWTEHALVLRGTGGESLDIPWLEHFAYGSKCERNDDWPSIEEVYAKMDEVHEKTMEHLRSLTSGQLDEPNVFNFSFGGKNDKRVLVHHAIRHEPMHVGQLSWIAKMNGVEEQV